MRYYTTQILSAKQELTPEKFLLCRDVPIARTGVMLYAAGEVPIDPVDGLCRVERDAQEVFSPATMASFEGKPVTLDHPAEDVAPHNWATLAKGITQNVRRGTGIENDLLLADLLITEAAAIQQVRDGLREVSCGYEADYLQMEPGRGRQTNIIGNHVALVEKGRCGARCAIGDSRLMKKNKWMDRLRAAFRNRDEAEMEKALNESATADEAEETEEEQKKRAAEESKKTGDALTKVADTLKTINARLTALETRDAQAQDEDESESEEESDEDKKKKESAEKSRDSAQALAEAQDVFARAEILAPGIQLPTHDAKSDAKKVRDSLCALRRRALETAFAGKSRDAITPFVGSNPDFTKLTCDALSSAFIGASEIVRRENNAAAKTTFDGGRTASDIASTISSINAKNAAFWSRQ